MTTPVDRLIHRHYVSQPGFQSGTAEFHEMCRGAFRQGGRILEIGAGASNETSRFLAGLGPVDGVDCSPLVLRNDALTTARVFDGLALPGPGGAYALCVSNYVLEHVEEPEAHFREVARVLEPGGAYCFRTPNVWHYVPLTARMTPHGVHRVLANRLRGLAADAPEPWPTTYRANSRRRLRRLCAESGLEVAELRMIEREPQYARLSSLLFYPMMAYERMVNRSEVLAGLRINILGQVIRPAEDRGAP